MKLNKEYNYNLTFLSLNEKDEVRRCLVKLEGGRWEGELNQTWVYFDDGFWWQSSNPKKDKMIVDARTLFSKAENKVVFNKPKEVVYLEDVNNDFIKYNIGIKFTSGAKAILVAKNKSEFFLVDDNIVIDSLDVYDDIFNVVSEKDEVFVFGTFIELLDWKAK